MSCTLFSKGGFVTPYNLFALLLLIHLAFGLKNLEVFRLIAYEKDGSLNGSKTTAVDSPGVHFLGKYGKFFIIIK